MEQLTTLQKQFCRSKAARRIFREALLPGGGKGYRRLFNGILEQTAAEMSDTQIAELLYYSLQCTDITAEERKEIMQILELI